MRERVRARLRGVAAAAVLISAGLASSGCGGSEPGATPGQGTGADRAPDPERLAASLMRLPLEPLGEPVARRTATPLWRWSAGDPDATADWTANSGEVTPGVGRGKPAVLLTPDRGELRVRVPLGLAAGGRLVLTAATECRLPHASLTAKVKRADGRVTNARVTLEWGHGERFVSLDLGQHWSEEQELLHLELELSSTRQAVKLYSLGLLSVTVDADLPEQSFGGFGLVAIDGDALRATTLRAGHALYTETDPLQAGSHLRFHYGVPSALDSGAEARTLRLRVEGNRSGLVVERSYDVGASVGRWLQGELDLGPLAEEGIYATFSYEGSGPDDLLALGEPAVFLPLESPPTVVLVTSDTHRGDHLGFLTTPDRLRTETLDRLAERGVAFVDAVSSANNTTPSHVALMTGLSPRDTKLVTNAVRLDNSALTLAEVFAAAGYVTLGAISATPLVDEHTNLGQGFDRYSQPHTAAMRDGSETLADLVDAIEAYPDQPLFCWLHLYDAHAPYTPTEENRRLFYPEGRDPYDPSVADSRPEIAPAWDRAIADPEFTEALYRSEVNYVDGLIERLLAVPRVGSGLLAFTSDHGETLSRGRDAHYDHEGISWNTLSVPLIFAGGSLPSGSSRAEGVRQIDVGRTLLNLSGLQAVDFPGRDLFAPEGSAPGPRFAIEANGLSASILADDDFLRMVLRPFPPDDTSSLHRVELFDLSTDPYCEHDVFEAREERGQELREQLVAWLMEAAPTNHREADAVISSSVKKELAALGYTTLDEGDLTRWIEPDCGCPWCARLRPAR